MPRRLKSYHFSLGNSSDGPVGLCFRVLARSIPQAVEQAKELLAQEEWNNTREARPVIDNHVEYFSFYTNPDAITKKDIDEWEWTDEYEEEA